MKAGWFRKTTTEAGGPDAIRRAIAAERWEELRAFRATHPLKHTTVSGVNWDYIARGGGEEALDLRSIYRLQIDLMQSFWFKPGDLASWPGRILILESDEDIVTPQQRARLKRCYPEAVVHTFYGAGHAPWMSHREEYLSAIKDFLDQHND